MPKTRNSRSRKPRLASKLVPSLSTYYKKRDLSEPLTLQVKYAEPSEQYKGKVDISFHEPGSKVYRCPNDWVHDVIVPALGDDMDLWPDHYLELYWDPSVKLNGKSVGGVRCHVAEEEVDESEDEGEGE